MTKVVALQILATVGMSLIFVGMLVFVVYFIDQAVGEEVELLSDKFDRWLRE